MSAATVKIEIPMQGISNINLGLDQMTGKLNKIEQKIVKAGIQTKVLHKTVKDSFRETNEMVSWYDKKIDRVQRDLLALVREEYKIALEMADSISPELRQIKKSLYEITDHTWSVTVKVVDQVTGQINSILKKSLPQLNKAFKINVDVQEERSRASLGSGKLTSFIEKPTISGLSFFNNFSNEFGSGIVETTSQAVKTVPSLITGIDNQIKQMSTAKSMKKFVSDFAGEDAVENFGAKQMSYVGAGLIAADALISAGNDFSTAWKTDDFDKKEAYNTAGALTLTGTAVGVVIGSAILPGIGTLIGAGIGKLIGEWGGNKFKEDYEEERILQEKEERQAKIREAQSKYETVEMKKAVEDLADGIITAEQASRIFTEQVNKGLRNHFGDIELSIRDIASLSEKIVFGDRIKEFQRFAEATEATKRNMEKLTESAATLDRLEWNAQWKVTLTEEEQKELETETEEYINNGLQGTSERGYQIQSARELLYEDGAEELMDESNRLTTYMNDQAKEAAEQWQEYLIEAMSDGAIDPKEYIKLEEHRNNFNQAMNLGVPKTPEEQLEMYETVYGGTDMSLGSFQKFLEQSGADASYAIDQYTQAAEVEYQAQNIKRNLPEGDPDHITNKKYQEELDKISTTRNDKIKEVIDQKDIMPYQMIADAYEDSLKNMFPDKPLEDLPEELKKTFHKAIQGDTDPSTWTIEEAATKMNMKGLSSENQGQIAWMLSALYETMSSEIIAALREKGKEKETETQSEQSAMGPSSPNEENGHNVSALDTTTLNTMPPNAATGQDMSFWERIISFSELAGGGEAFWDTCPSIPSSGDADKEPPFYPYYETNTPMNTVTEPVEQLESYGASATVDLGIAEGIANADIESINEAINTLKEEVGAAIDSAFSAGFETSTSVNITVNYKLANPSATVVFSGGGIGTAFVTSSIASKVAENANGDIINGPLLSWIGEDGPEAIIPLGSKRRDRGLSLWQRAGEILGVGKYANGGIMHGNTYNYNWDSDEETKSYLPSGSDGSSLANQDNAGGINVSVNMSPTFEINNEQDSGENGVVSVLKSHIRDMTDEVADELAVRLQKIFGNMPTKEA